VETTFTTAQAFALGAGLGVVLLLGGRLLGRLTRRRTD